MAASKLNIGPLRDQWIRTSETPFDSDKKTMVVQVLGGIECVGDTASWYGGEEHANTHMRLAVVSNRIDAYGSAAAPSLPPLLPLFSIPLPPCSPPPRVLRSAPPSLPCSAPLPSSAPPCLGPSRRPCVRPCHPPHTPFQESRGGLREVEVGRPTSVLFCCALVRAFP